MLVGLFNCKNEMFMPVKTRQRRRVLNFIAYNLQLISVACKSTMQEFLAHWQVRKEISFGVLRSIGLGIKIFNYGKLQT